MTDPQTLANKVLNHPTFIAIKRFSYDLDTLAAKYPDGAPDHIIASALLVAEEDVEQIWQNAVTNLKRLLGVSGASRSAPGRRG